MNRPSPVEASALAGTLLGAAAITGLVAGIELNRDPREDIWSNAWLVVSVILAVVAVAVVVAYFFASMIIHEESSREGAAQKRHPSEGEVRKPAESPVGREIAASRRDTGRDTSGRALSAQIKFVRTLTGHSRKVIGVAFSPDGTLLATCSADDTVRLWNIATGKVVRRLIGHANEINGVAFTHDGALLATGSDDHTARLWDVSSGNMVRTFTGHTDMVLGVAISPDGALLATGSYDKTARLWDSTTGELLRTFTGHTDHVWAVAFSPDGALLATGSYDKTARLWDPVTGEGVRTFIGHDDVIYGTAFSPDGVFLATGSDDKTARVWDVATGELVEVLAGHDGRVFGVAFSPDGAFLATGSDDKTARVWDVATGELVEVLAGHDGRVFGVAFSPDGALIATSSEDKTAQLWSSELLVERVQPAEADGTEQAAKAQTLANSAVAHDTAAAAPTQSAPTVIDRWRHTSDGGEVPSLMRLTSTSLFHPAIGSRQPQETPPSVKIGIVVGCPRIDPGLSGTVLRSKFIAFLSSPAVSTLVQALSDVDHGASWKSMAGNGSRTLEAALTVCEDPLAEAPVALALFIPPAGDVPLLGLDGQSATLLLYVEPQTVDGLVPSASNLATWSRRFSQALGLPGAFVNFLNEELGATTSNDPPAQCGVWLQSQHQPLTVMVGIEGLRLLPGRSPSNQFIGWTVATPDGKPAATVSRELIVQLCDYELHLDDFERALIDEMG